MLRLRMADRRGTRERPLPIDWMHFKTSENFARKCVIFDKKIFLKFSGEWTNPTFPPPIQKFLGPPLRLRLALYCSQIQVNTEAFGA